jgi:hypothetical protein
MKWSAIVGLAVVVGLPIGMAACQTRPPEDILAKDDSFRPYRELESGVLRIIVNPGHVLIRLIAQIDRKTGASITIAKVQHSYLGQHRSNYDTARNAKAEPLKFSVVARYGNCHVRKDCPLDELYIVEIPEAELRAAGAQGYPFKVFPRVGHDVLITVPQVMVKSLLTLLDADRRSGGVEATRSKAQ